MYPQQPQRPNRAVNAAAVVWLIIGLLILSPCIIAILLVSLNSFFQMIGLYQ